MELFSFSFANTSFLLSASESGLFAYPVHNERPGHPSLLCANYRTGLSGCVYNQTLYYAYLTKENSLLIRRLSESGTLFRLDCTDTVIYSNPQLIVFSNTLYLFYTEEKGGAYRLKLWQLFPHTKRMLPDSLSAFFPAPPRLSLSATEQYLYIVLTSGTTELSYRFSASSSFELLRSEEEVLSNLRLPWEAEEAQLKQTILQAIHLSEQQQNLLTEKEQKLKHAETRISQLTAEAEQATAMLADTTSALLTVEKQLTECEINRQQTLKELEQTSLLLDRAKTQYNELMQVAEQYRQEALKWYGKFTDLH